MSGDDEPSDDEDKEPEIASPEDFVEDVYPDREESIENTTLNDCEQLRTAGDSFRTAESRDEAIENVADDLDVSQERADWLVSVYLTIFTSTMTHVTTNAIQIGQRYYTSDKPLADLYEPTQIETVEKAEEYLMEYVGAHVNELDEQSVTFESELPDKPPSPFDDIQPPDIAGELQAFQTMAPILAEQMQEVASKLNTLAPVWQQQMSQVTTGVETLTPVLQEQMEQLREGLDISSMLADVIEPLGEIGQQFETFREIKESDFEFKWLSEVSYGAFVDLYVTYEKHGNEAAAERLAEELRDEDDIEEFKDYFATFDEYTDRQDIVDEALDAHTEGRYALSIPTIMSQLDGVFIDAVIDIGLWPQSARDDVTAVAVVSKGEDSPRHIPEIDDAFRDYYKRNLWPDRNDILHGKRTDYADNELLSARLIWLFFQTLHTVENIRSAADIGDYYILRTINNRDGCKPEAIADELSYQLEYVEERCSALEDQQAITSTSEEWIVTNIGEEYLDGDRQLNGY